MSSPFDFGAMQAQLLADLAAQKAALQKQLAADAPKVRTFPICIMEDHHDGFVIRGARLAGGDGLASGEYLLSPQNCEPGTPKYAAAGRYTYVMQGDGNFVLYDGAVSWKGGVGKGNALWASDTAGHPGATLEMQIDGNLVIYDVTHRPIWATGTAGNPGALLYLQSDTNFVIWPNAAGGKLWSRITGGSSFGNLLGQIAGAAAVVFPVVSLPILLGTGNVDAAVNVAETSAKVAKDVVTGNIAGAVSDAIGGIASATAGGTPGGSGPPPPPPPPVVYRWETFTEWRRRAFRPAPRT